MERPSWAPEGIDLDRPNAARMYDYALGGSHNFAVDREMVEKVEAMMPGSSLIAHANRGFLRRAVGYCLDAGVRQFIDVGSGIPTVGSIHEVARQVAPDTHVVYVDVDPIAVAHSQAILRGDPHTAAIHGDVRRPAEILADPQVTRLIDFDRPVAVLLLAVLHFIAEADDPGGLVRRFGARLAPGSYLVLSHGTPDERPDDADTVGQLYKGTSNPLSLRSRAEIQALFGEFALVEPGLTWVSAWHPVPGQVDEPERREMLAGVGRRR
jgi:SAM-dependent methyltransferase